MKRALYLALGLSVLACAPVWAQSVAAFPQGEQSSDPKPVTTPAERQEARAAANVAAPNTADNVIPNGTATANPPGAGASSSATLMDHGEVGTAANSNTGPAADIGR